MQISISIYIFVKWKFPQAYNAPPTQMVIILNKQNPTPDTKGPRLSSWSRLSIIGYSVAPACLPEVAVTKDPVHSGPLTQTDLSGIWPEGLLHED